MIQPQLIFARDGKLTASVGDRGRNRNSDVALIQTLLVDCRGPQGRPYFCGKVDGRFGRDTATALAAYRRDNRDATSAQPLRSGSPILRKLARNQPIAVLDGTTTAYQTTQSATPGRLDGKAAADLSDKRKQALVRILADLTKRWGILFDLKIVGAGAPSYALIGQLIPQRCVVRNAQRWCPAVPNPDRLRQQAPALFRAIDADFRRAVASAVPITDSVDRRVNAGLAGQFRAVVNTGLEWALAEADRHLQDFKRYKNPLAAILLEHYLGATGRPYKLTVQQALSVDLIQNAVDTNLDRFKELTFHKPKSTNTNAFGKMQEVRKPNGQNPVYFDDQYEYDISLGDISGWGRYTGALATDFRDTWSVFFWYGQCQFQLSRSFHGPPTRWPAADKWTDHS